VPERKGTPKEKGEEAMNSVCAACHQVKEVHLTMDQGPICRTCFDGATWRALSIVVNGVMFSQTQKGRASHAGTEEAEAGNVARPAFTTKAN
jgi:hypothetical protein